MILLLVVVQCPPERRTTRRSRLHAFGACIDIRTVVQQQLDTFHIAISNSFLSLFNSVHSFIHSFVQNDETNWGECLHAKSCVLEL